jgi:hypothetical protein
MVEEGNSMPRIACYGLRQTPRKSILAASEMTFALLVQQAGLIKSSEEQS